MIILKKIHSLDYLISAMTIEYSKETCSGMVGKIEYNRVFVLHICSKALHASVGRSHVIVCVILHNLNRDIKLADSVMMTLTKQDTFRWLIIHMMALVKRGQQDKV